MGDIGGSTVPPPATPIAPPIPGELPSPPTVSAGGPQARTGPTSSRKSSSQSFGQKPKDKSNRVDERKSTLFFYDNSPLSEDTNAQVQDDDEGAGDDDAALVIEGFEHDAPVDPYKGGLWDKLADLIRGEPLQFAKLIHSRRGPLLKRGVDASQLVVEV